MTSRRRHDGWLCAFCLTGARVTHLSKIVFKCALRCFSSALAAAASAFAAAASCFADGCPDVLATGAAAPPSVLRRFAGDCAAVASSSS